MGNKFEKINLFPLYRKRKQYCKLAHSAAASPSCFDCDTLLVKKPFRFDFPYCDFYQK